MDVIKDKRYLQLCRLYPSVFKIDDYGHNSQHIVEKSVENTIFSGEYDDYITVREHLNYSPYETAHTGNIRIKTYIDGSCDILVCNRDIFRSGEFFDKIKDVRKTDTISADGLEWRNNVDCLLWDLRPDDIPQGFDDCAPVPAPATLSAVRRAQSRLKELLLSNSFDYFITLTLSADSIDRYDYGVIIKKLSKWLGNRVQRNNWKYVLVPEFHEDGAIHFHGVVAGDMKIEHSGTVKVHNKKKPVRLSTYERYYKGQPCSVVYNVTDWAVGFSTAVKLDDKPHAVASYISKYITKDSHKVGGRWYLSGGDLNRADVQIIRGDWFDFVSVFKPFQIDGRNESFVGFRLSADGQVFGTTYTQ